MSRTAREDDVIVKQRRGKHGSRLQSQVIYDVGPPRSKPHLRWIHDGVKPHVISAVAKYSHGRFVAAGRKKRRLVGQTRGKQILASASEIFGLDVDHPGISPRQWLRQAHFVSQDAMMKAMAEALRKAIPKQVKKLASSKFTSTLVRRIIR